jgi:hypothetical protein
VFENRVLRRIFRPKREEVTGDWRRLHKDLCKYHVSQARTGEMNSERKFLVRKPEVKKPFGRPMHRWEDDIGMDQKENLK